MYPWWLWHLICFYHSLPPWKYWDKNRTFFPGAEGNLGLNPTVLLKSSLPKTNAPPNRICPKWTSNGGYKKKKSSSSSFRELKMTLGSVAQSHPTLCGPMDCSLPGSSIHGIFQARMLAWVAISFSRGCSRPRDRMHISCVSCIARRILKNDGIEY